MTINVLLVEDDIDLSATLVDYLALADIDCDHAANGQLGLRLAEANRYDVLVVDVSMPVLDGLGLCERLRVNGIDVPLLLLTARDALVDKLAGFQAGADDYLTKPFELDELVARIRALSGRRSGQSPVRDIDGLRIDFDQKCASRNGRKLELTPTGWRMLEALARSSPKALSREGLFAAGWRDEVPSRNSFNVQLHRLRRAVDGADEEPLLHTIAGIGVRLGGRKDV
ncbi:MAG: response regulator transcription factor [Pseudomonadota bacterium]